MNRIVKILSVAVMSFWGISASSVYADNLEWMSKDYDFGTFREAGGPVKGMLKFVNKGDGPTVINLVKPTCGCTGAEYTEGLIAPGDTAYVSFTYNPVGRPGKFDKTLKVYTGRNSDLTVLHIRGTVIGTPQTLERDYPYRVGNLRLSERDINMGEMKYGTSRHRFIKLYNESDKVLRPVVKSSDKALEVDLAVDEIAPGDIGTLSMYFLTRQTDGPGPYVAKISLLSDVSQPKEDALTILYKAEIVADNSEKTPEEMAQAPRCEVKNFTVDLGVVKGREKKFEFEVHNGGLTALSINKIYNRQGQIVFRSWAHSVAVGKEGTVKGVLNLEDIPEGPFRVPVEIQSNDPLRPVVTVNVVGIKK